MARVLACPAVVTEAATKAAEEAKAKGEPKPRKDHSAVHRCVLDLGGPGTSTELRADSEKGEAGTRAGALCAPSFSRTSPRRSRSSSPAAGPRTGRVSRIGCWEPRAARRKAGETADTVSSATRCSRFARMSPGRSGWGFRRERFASACRRRMR